MLVVLRFLIIRDLSVEDGGLYRCVVTTANCGTRYPPEISINSEPFCPPTVACDSIVVTGVHMCVSSWF